MKTKTSTKLKPKPADENLIEGISFDYVTAEDDNEDSLRNEISNMWSTLVSDETTDVENPDDATLETKRKKAKSSRKEKSLVSKPSDAINLHSSEEGDVRKAPDSVAKINHKSQFESGQSPIVANTSSNKRNIDGKLTREVVESNHTEKSSKPEKKKMKKDKGIEGAGAMSNVLVEKESVVMNPEISDQKGLKLIKKKRSKEAYMRRRQLSKERLKAKKAKNAMTLPATVVVEE